MSGADDAGQDGGADGDGRLAPVEGMAEDSVAAFHRQVAQAARDRAAAWDAVGQVLEPPDEALVERLRSGGLATVLRLSARWLGQDADLFTNDLMSLDVFARAARRRDPADDLASLRADHTAVVVAGDDGSGVATDVRTVAALCREEAEAWAAGDLAGGKQLRVREREAIEKHLVPVLPGLADRLRHEAGAQVWRTLASVILAVLSVESGKDYQRAVLGERRDGAPHHG